jgi:hypothetical protein
MHPPPTLLLIRNQSLVLLLWGSRKSAAMPFSCQKILGNKFRQKTNTLGLSEKVMFYNKCCDIRIWISSPVSVPDPLPLKGQCHEIFDPRFFCHQTIPPRALIQGLKLFRIWLRIRRENRVGNRQNRLPRSDRDRGSRLFFLLELPFNRYVF